MKLGYQDWFGFLPVKESFTIENVRVEVFPDYDRFSKFVDTHANKDGYVYPPMTYETRGSYKGKGKFSEVNSFQWNKVSKSDRPALLHKLPPSHRLILSESSKEPRQYEAAFIIYIISYLYGIKLQFYDWWFDQRIPIEQKHRIGFSHKKAEEFFSHAYNYWSSLDINKKKQLNNILYMNIRSLSYEWDWERFAVDYMVFDAIYYFCKRTYSLKGSTHKLQMIIICERFHIPYKSELIKEIINLRHNLFHNVLWDKEPPTGDTSRLGYECAIGLRQLNQRLIVALMNYKTTYLETPWPIIVACVF